MFCSPDFCFRNTDFAISKVQNHVTFNAAKCSRRVSGPFLGKLGGFLD